MSNVKYYYDSETLTYRQIIRKKTTAFKHTLMFLIAASIVGFLFVLVAGQYFESPKEKALNRELQNLELHFNLLNKKMEEVEAVLTNIEDRDNAIYRLSLRSTLSQKPNENKDWEALTAIKNTMASIIRN